MAGWTLVNSTTITTTFSPPATSAPINTTAADIILFCYAGNSAPSITDSAGNTWLPAVSGASSQTGAIYYTRAPLIASGSHTFTIGNITASCAILAYSGSLTTSTPLDQTNFGTWPAPTTEQPGSITPAQNNELLVLACAMDQPAATSTAFNNGFTQQILLDVVVGNTYGLTVATLVQANKAAINPTMTRGVAGTNTDVALIASFEAAPVVAGVPLFASRTRIVII